MDGIMTILTPVVASAITFFLGCIVSNRKLMKKKQKSHDMLLLGLARKALVDECEKAKDKGYCSPNYKLLINSIYEPYRESGGNGFVAIEVKNTLDLPDRQ